MADIDNFKAINRTFGTKIGDEVVNKLVSIFANNLSEAESMILKSSYFTKTQVGRLSALSKDTERTEAFLLREALDDLFKKYSK